MDGYPLGLDHTLLMNLSLSIILDAKEQGTFIVQTEVLLSLIKVTSILRTTLCGGITAKGRALLSFSTSTGIYTSNSGQQGGAISLYSKSVLQLISDVHIIFSSNEPQKGGAIFLDDKTYMDKNRLRLYHQLLNEYILQYI